MKATQITPGAKFEAKLIAIQCVGRKTNEFKTKTVDQILSVNNVSIEFTVKGSNCDWMAHLNNDKVLRICSIGRKNYKETYYEVR